MSSVPACKNHPSVSEGIEPCAICRVHFCADCLVARDGRRLCASCKDGPTARFKGHGLARVTTRTWAFLIDMALLTSIFYAASWALGGMDGYVKRMSEVRGEGWAVFFPILSVRMLIYTLPTTILWIVYEALMLQRQGQTVGKFIVRIKVIADTGEPLTARHAWTRALARVGMSTLVGQFAILDYLAVFIGKERATAHDRIARTRVVDAR